MTEEVKQEDQEEVMEEDVCSSVANLSAALSNLEDIDKGLMNTTDQKMFKRMKRQIFMALYYYCECLPQADEPG